MVSFRSSHTAVVIVSLCLVFLTLTQRWLERTPGLSKDEFHFWNKYRAAVAGWIRNDFLEPAEAEADPTMKRLKMDEYTKTKVCYIIV